MSNTESRDLADLLITLTRVLHTQMKKRAIRQPLSMIQIHTMAYIVRNRPSMHELAQRLTITAPSATTLVNKLVRLKLVHRIPDPDDHRALHLELTKHGMSFLQQRLVIVTKGLQEITSVLHPNERRTFIRLLDKVISSHAKRNP